MMVNNEILAALWWHHHLDCFRKKYLDYSMKNGVSRFPRPRFSCFARCFASSTRTKLKRSRSGRSLPSSVPSCFTMAVPSTTWTWTSAYNSLVKWCQISPEKNTSCLWFTCDVTSCHYNSASTVETLNYIRIAKHSETVFGGSNVFWIPTRYQREQEKWWEARPRRPSTIEHRDVCRSCCDQRACDLVVLPGYLLARGVQNVMKPQAQIALVLGINLGTGGKSQGTDFCWKKIKAAASPSMPSSDGSCSVHFQNNVLLAIEVK